MPEVRPTFLSNAATKPHHAMLGRLYGGAGAYLKFSFIFFEAGVS